MSKVDGFREDACSDDLAEHEVPPTSAVGLLEVVAWSKVDEYRGNFPLINSSWGDTPYLFIRQYASSACVFSSSKGAYL